MAVVLPEKGSPAEKIWYCCVKCLSSVKLDYLYNLSKKDNSDNSDQTRLSKAT